MTEPAIDMQNGHKHTVMVQVNTAGEQHELCGCGISLIPLNLGAVIYLEIDENSTLSH